jgi:hypothetical protein
MIRGGWFFSKIYCEESNFLERIDFFLYYEGHVARPENISAPDLSRRPSRLI